MAKRKRDENVKLSVLERCALRDTIQATLDDREQRRNLKAWRVHALERIAKRIPPVKV